MESLQDLLAKHLTPKTEDSSVSGKVYRIDDLAFKRVKVATQFRPLTSNEWLEWTDEDGGYYMVCAWATDGRSAVIGAVYRVDGGVPASDLQVKPRP